MSEIKPPSPMEKLPPDSSPRTGGEEPELNVGEPDIAPENKGVEGADTASGEKSS